MAIIIHKFEDFEKMRAAGLLAARTLDLITQYVEPGVTTNRLDKICYDFIISNGAIPAPLNYRPAGHIPFPKSICTSLNHVVCHGVPNDRALKNGDILNIDVTVILDGWHGDSSRMYYVGKVEIKPARLIKVTYEAMMEGINIVKPGVRFGDIGHAIQKFAEKYNFSVVREYTGHGIGRVFHDEPSVPAYGKKNTGELLQEGMFFTIEPMINAGKPETIVSKIDRWTVTTRDKNLSAQFEHTIGVTKTGHEIFTLSPENLCCPPYGS
ncbi:MAG: type I methionyl aminopeptidase [Janthinobacterium lividum]